MTQPNPKNYTFTRQAAVSASLQQADDVRKNAHRALHLNIPQIKDYFAPVVPGQVVVVLGQSSSGKSLFAETWYEDHGQQLIRDGRDNEVPVVIHLEDTVEEVFWQKIANKSGISVQEIARGQIDDWGKFTAAAAKLYDSTILHVAYSLTYPNADRCLSLKFVMQCVNQGIKEMTTPSYKPIVASLWLDYLQILAENEQAIKGVNDQRRLRVKADMYEFRGLCQQFQAPGVLLCQAKQTLTWPYTRELLIPGLFDGEETSAVGQHADRILSVAMPKMFLRRGENFRFAGQSIPVKDEYQFLWVVKQRGKLPSGKCFLLQHKFSDNTVLVVDTDQK